MTAEELRAAQTLVRRLPVGESVVEAILAIVRAGRPESSDLDEVVEHVGWGRPAGKSGANAHVSRAGVNRRPSLAVLGRCRRACEACATASYGAEVRGASFRRDGRFDHRPLMSTNCIGGRA